VKLYPFLKKENFSNSQKKVRKVRDFLNEFAKSNNFNPLDLERWCSVTRKEVLGARGNKLLYDKSYVRALRELHPQLTFNFLNPMRKR